MNGLYKYVKSNFKWNKFRIWNIIDILLSDNFLKNGHKK